MKTYFKFLPVFFCLFFILSGGSCGGSKNVAKQPWEQNENPQDGDHSDENEPKGNKSGDKPNDGNHGGGAGGGNSATPTPNISVSTDAAAGNTGGGGSTDSSNSATLPPTAPPAHLIITDSDSIVYVENWASLKSSPPTTTGGPIAVTFVQEKKGQDRQKVQLSLTNNSSNSRKFATYEGRPLRTWYTLKDNNRFVNINVTTDPKDNKCIVCTLQGKVHPNGIMNFFKKQNTQNTKIGCYCS